MNKEENPSLAEVLSGCTIGATNPTQISQIQHRLNILESWFGSLGAAETALSNRHVLEIGCGQGDTTVALAHMVSNRGGSSRLSAIPATVTAIDPAPLDYGTPFTLGESQDCLSQSQLGPAIRWTQQEPIHFLANNSNSFDYIVLAHSIFYLKSEEYFTSLLKSLSSFVSRGTERQTKLLLAEWGMRASTPEAEVHICAVNAQIASPPPDGNIRTVLEPEKIKQIAQSQGWRFEKECWIEQPDVEDGKWEVSAARNISERSGADAGSCGKDVEAVIEANRGGIRSMDVWTSVWDLSV